jgi:hypothetical protein
MCGQPYLLLFTFFFFYYCSSASATTALAEYHDPNPITSGFSTCYIDLAFFSEFQDFSAPPEIPVTLTYSGAHVHAENSYDKLIHMLKERTIKHVKINCLAIFLFLPHQNVLADVKADNSSLDRYFLILKRYMDIFQSGYVINTYLIVVQHQNSNADHGDILSRWGRTRQLNKLPVFYLTKNAGLTNNKISLAVELRSPCPFKISTELIGLGWNNTRKALDQGFRIGLKIKCRGIGWWINELTSNATSPCVSFMDPSRTHFYEQQTSAIVAIVVGPFANSSAFYDKYFGFSDDFQFQQKEKEACMNLLEYSVDRRVQIAVGYEAATEANNNQSIHEILYEESYNFLTCDGTENYLSFAAYASPFLWELWVGIAIFSMMILVFLIAFLHFKRIRVSFMLLIPSVLLEQPPEFSSQLLKYRSFKCLLIPLLLSSLVLTNSYKSVVTTDLTAQFSTRRVETFDDVIRLAYKILPPFNTFIARVTQGSWQFYANRSIDRRIKRERNIFILSFSTLSIALRAEVNSPNTLPLKRIQYQSMLSLIEAPENFPKISFQMEISKCNKSIYVDNNYQLDQFRVEVLRLGKGHLTSKLYTGKESFQKQLFSWRIIGMEWDRTGLISKKWSALSHSGIFSQLNNVYKSGEMKSQIREIEKLFGENEEDSARPLALKSTVISIFIIYLASVVFCIIILFAENIFNIFYKLKLKAWIVKV